MAAKRCSYTIGYCSSTMPSEVCLWAMRASTASGKVPGLLTRWLAKAAMEPARACCCVPLVWFAREKSPSRSSGWAANSRA